MGRSSYPVLTAAAVPRICRRTSTRGTGRPPSRLHPVLTRSLELRAGLERGGPPLGRTARWRFAPARSPCGRSDPACKRLTTATAGTATAPPARRAFAHARCSRAPKEALPSRRRGPEVPAGPWGVPPPAPHRPGPLLTLCSGPGPTVAGDDREVWASECLALSMPPWMR